MRKQILWLALFFILPVCRTAFSQRETISLNRYWLFSYQPYPEPDMSFFSHNSDNSNWISVSIPHTWSTYETTGDRHPFIKSASERADPYWWKGWGYYKKEFFLESFPDNKKFFLEFDGVQKYCQVYLNGKLLGNHKGGYTGFSFDITDHISYGKNELWVFVSNLRDDPFGGIPPMSAGNFNVYGGIYRDIKLVVTGKTYIPYQGSYEHQGGTFITVPCADSSTALVNIRTYVKNENKGHDDIQITSKIIDPAGNIIQILDTIINTCSPEIKEIEQKSKIIEKPCLWSPETPNIYQVISEIRVHNQLSDQYRSSFGIRWFWWDHETDSLWLNGKPVQIHGTNRHQEYPWLGDAVPKWLILRDMLDIKNNLGHNFIRAAHYPNDPYLYHLTDSLGLIVVEEVPNIKPINFGEEIQKSNLVEMIRRDRNHPSILFWSMGNETNDAADSRWAWDEDTTRILHQRKSEEYGDFVTHDHTNLDMENLLRVTVRGWYNKDVKNLEPQNSPEIPKSGQHAGTEEWQHKMAMVEDGSIRGRIDRNIVAWLYADHGCDRIYTDAPLKYINYKGWVDSYRVPKYMYYLWQAYYAPYAMISIMPHYWRPAYKGTRQNFTVDSNCEMVGLSANKLFYGFQYPGPENYYSVNYKDILVEDGYLVATGYNDNKPVCQDTLFMASQPKKLKIWVEHDKLCAGKTGIALVWVEVLDDNNFPVIGANPDIFWNVTGKATLVGPEEYRSDIDKSSAEEGEGYVTTPVFNIIRTTNTPGLFKIEVSAQNLESDSVTLFSEECKPENPLIHEPVPECRNQKIQKISESIDSFEVIIFLEEITSNRIFADTGITGYSDELREWLIHKHLTGKTNTSEFGYLIDLLENYLLKMNGELIADDFNFIINRYNQLCSFTQSFRNLHLHKEFSDYIVEYHAEMVLKKSETLNYSGLYKQYLKHARNNLIVEFKNPDEFHTEGTILHSRTLHKMLIYSTDFLAGLKKLNPEFTGFSIEKQHTYLMELEGLNPELTIDKNHQASFRYDIPYMILNKKD